jgi:hypothetical protein
MPEGQILDQITINNKALKNNLCPGKIGDRKMAEFAQKWQKRG